MILKKSLKVVLMSLRHIYWTSMKNESGKNRLKEANSDKIYDKAFARIKKDYFAQVGEAFLQDEQRLRKYKAFWC